MNKIIASTLVLGLVASLSSCKGRYDNSSAPKINATVENIFSEFSNMADQAITGNLFYYKNGTLIVNDLATGNINNEVKSPCSVIVTLDTLNSAKTITIDWGTNNCDCNDGKQRRGKLITTFTGSYYAQGTVITHTPVDYYVNDNKVEGTKVVTNMGLNTLGQPYYNLAIDGVVTFATGEIVNYTSSRVRTFTDGFTTLLNFYDDEYDITGTANATVVNGDGYVATITSPLHLKIGCGYITKGEIEITPTDKPVRIINYGDGTCDGTFTITINGQTFTING